MKARLLQGCRTTSPNEYSGGRLELIAQVCWKRGARLAEGAAETVVREFLSLEMAGDAESARVWAEARRYLANVTPHFTRSSVAYPCSEARAEK